MADRTQDTLTLKAVESLLALRINNNLTVNLNKVSDFDEQSQLEKIALETGYKFSFDDMKNAARFQKTKSH